MSTHTRYTTTESPPYTDPLTRPKPFADVGADATTNGTETPGDRSGLDRCQQLFSTRDATRLRNLADGENHAMPDGV